MSSRDDILRSIRRHLPPATELPPREGAWVRYSDPIRQFADVLEAVGGECVEVEDLSAIPPRLGDLAAADRTVVSCVPGLFEGRFNLDAVDDPHDLEHVDLAVMPGQLAVAENAAVWVTDAGIRHRVLYFLSQHLALVIDRNAIVHNMHEAYRRIDAAEGPFGTFISGPSKTADIEQALVKGAHGARTLTVFLLGSPAGT